MIDSSYFIFNSSKSNILYMIRPYPMPTIFPMKKAPREGIKAFRLSKSSSIPPQVKKTKWWIVVQPISNIQYL
jgi:hypothetical protein